MIGKYWEHFTHDAGIGLRGIGGTIEDAFEQTAMALTWAITDPREVVPPLTQTCGCSKMRPVPGWLNVWLT
ncbi:MAG TPA: archease [Blastocatellia bacterium]|nr:archease [Blastocatellia bacterium]